MFLADADPFGPASVASAVGVDDRSLVVLEGGACLFEHAAGQFRRRAVPMLRAAGAPSKQSMTVPGCNMSIFCQVRLDGCEVVQGNWTL